MNTLIGDGRLEIGGQLRPYYIGTYQTAIFCELQAEGFDLQDYNQLLLEVALNQHNQSKAAREGVAYAPSGRKALTAAENRDFLYSALVAGAKRERLPVDFDADQVGFWIDEAAAEEAAKPFATHYRLLFQRLERQQGQPGNVPAPPLTSARGGKKSPAKKGLPGTRP